MVGPKGVNVVGLIISYCSGRSGGGGPGVVITLYATGQDDHQVISRCDHDLS